MANTKKTTDKLARKKIKRASRKVNKATKPKAPRTHPRGEKKQKVKKATRGAAKR